MIPVAHYTSTFPLVSTTFIQREVRALRAAGVTTALIANSRPATGQYHASDRDLLDETTFLSEIPRIQAALDNLTCFLRAPVRYVRTLLTALTLPTDESRGRRGETLRHFFAAAPLAGMCRRRRVRHLHVHFAFGAAAVALFSRLLGGPAYSVAIHGSDVLLPYPLTFKKLRAAAFVVSNCDFHVANLRGKYPPLQQQVFHVIRLGIDLMREPWIAAHVSVGGPVRVACVGRLVEVKAHSLLVEACAIVRGHGCEVVCRIAGDGPLRTALEAQVAALGVGNAVHFMGTTNESGIAALMEWSHVVALSSLSEGTPMTIIEAMAKGRAVVAPEMTAIPEMVDNNSTGLLFARGSAEDLARALRYFCDQPDAAPLMGGAGRAKAVALFDDRVQSQKLAELLNRAGGS